jgi:uncharacterized ferritin-like protein (DUF455 family)
MKNFFTSVKEVLIANTIKNKIDLFSITFEKFKNEKLDFSPTSDIEIFTKPAYYDFCTIVDAKEVPQRKSLHTNEGKSILLHAVAHIEYSAIDLALDACYRFQNMPKQFYIDWMEVAADEMRHFSMLQKELEKYNITYGDLPVHQGLFEASMRSLELIPRMALIPRYMEANGLDANAMIIDKLKKIPNTEDIVQILQTILDEEIDHVRKGDTWYKYACSQKENFSCDYFDIVNKVYPNSFRTNKNVNVEARKKAGFSDEEIQKLLNF